MNAEMPGKTGPETKGAPEVKPGANVKPEVKGETKPAATPEPLLSEVRMAAILRELYGPSAPQPPSAEEAREAAEERARGPSDRDFDLHALVCQKGTDLRQAAGKFGLSQGQAGKIMAKVDAWQEEIEGGPKAPEQRRRTADFRYRGRLNHFYSLAMKAWEDSQREQTLNVSERDLYGAFKKNTSRTSAGQGETRYIEPAIRISEKIAQLDGVITRPRQPAAERKQLENDLSPPALDQRGDFSGGDSQGITAQEFVASGSARDRRRNRRQQAQKSLITPPAAPPGRLSPLIPVTDEEWEQLLKDAGHRPK